MGDVQRVEIVVPATGGKRSTSALGRAVVADALAGPDPVGSRAVSRETDWRRGYGAHFVRLVEAGLQSQEAAVDIAQHGLESLHARMRATVRKDAVANESTAPTAEGDTDDEIPLKEVFAIPRGGSDLQTATVQGEREPERELTIPFRGDRLKGASLDRQLDSWVERGSMEPSAAKAIREVAANPDWLAMPGRRLVVLGASAEMGPLRAALRWGVEAIAMDLPKPAVWREIIDIARDSAGTLHLPVGADSSQIADHAGADLLSNLPGVASWLRQFDGQLVLGNYVYADGATNLRVSSAVDALTAHLLNDRDDVALAFLATPTDVFAVPTEVVEFSKKAYENRKLRYVRPIARAVSAGRLLRRNYAPGPAPGINDSIVVQQGPNYILAKRLQRWRATAACRAGVEVSLNVAPPTRTRSVLKNRALAAAYAGAHRFGVEVFAPSTSNTLMAALLIHDLYSGTPSPQDPWRAEADNAVHGGLWRGPYSPRSALGIAAALGIGSART
ncbi:hypothetical protein CLV47_10720 [Antricoccus suffuscus]|uniref:Uncharacterized protein n=1 Tax=Antricoccus suffuscus TaxID=1629062 RepID=A0A2T1A040_9ACTN|nr:hypothetical protein [Antricoccus suffuscus]PRZ41894.1 hypothetical protein CLV47_10720 [Antricoccus suffuscus]